MIPEGITEQEFLEYIKKLDPAHRVLARIEFAKQQMKEQQSWHSYQTSQL